MKKQLIAIAASAIMLWNCTDHDQVNLIDYELNPESVAGWKGSLKTGYFNNGTIAVQSENLTVLNGKVTAGSFTIPVSSILNLNLPTDELKEQLVHHLQSADFFNMALHPSVTYKITDVVAYSGNKPGDVAGANFMVNGSLTIFGKSNPLSFPAKIFTDKNGISVEADLKFDRTIWGITYATDPSLPAENFIEPLIEVSLRLAGHKK